jgi:MGT family glycosyltransferase
MTDRTVAVFGIPGRGHIQRLRHVVSGLVQHGFTTHVLTDSSGRREIEQAGGRFVDLFAAYPLDEVDAESMPLSCRLVSFAGAYAEAIARDVARLEPSLVVYDTFAVVGRVVARLLGLPYVNLCHGHNADPARLLPLLEGDPRRWISPACYRAVETLRELGIEDASPHCYVTGLSPYLNVYCEPAAYLTAVERDVFEPVAFYGSLPSIEEIAARSTEGGPSLFGTGAERQLRVYVSLGTVVWRRRTVEALEVLGIVASALATRPDVCGLISLGGGRVSPEAVRALTKTNVQVAEYVDQWRVLREADVFITHQGLNSVHEAVYNQVPMISYPFLFDQPALAEKCYGFGFATPLRDSMAEGVTEKAVHAALARVAVDGESMRTRMAEAREWEREAIAGRDAAIERISRLL